MRGGKPVHRPELLNDSVLAIMTLYSQEYRGFVEYYRMAYNLSGPLGSWRSSAPPLKSFNSMESRQLFLRVLHDLEQRLQSNDEYDILNIARLLRQLLIDGGATEASSRSSHEPQLPQQ